MNIIPLPRPQRLVVVQQAPAGGYGYLEPTTEVARIDITGCLNGYRVWVCGRPFRDFVSLSNASRCAAALMTLDALDALPSGPFNSPKGAAGCFSEPSTS